MNNIKEATYHLFEVFYIRADRHCYQSNSAYFVALFHFVLSLYSQLYSILNYVSRTKLTGNTLDICK